MKNANITNITTSRVPREEPVPTLRDKGKGAFSTENRRLTWDLVVWPMLLQLNRPYFTLNEFRIKRNEICICPSKFQIIKKIGSTAYDDRSMTVFI